MQLVTVPLPPDVEYAIDTALEHEEIDASTHIALKLYAPRRSLMDLIDEEGNWSPEGRRHRLKRCEAMMDLASSIIAELSPEQRGPIAVAGIQHCRLTVQGSAWAMATFTHQDAILGGCMLPHKRARNDVERRRMTELRLTPKQHRRLYAPGFIRRAVRSDEETARVTRLADRTLQRATGLDLDRFLPAAVRLSEMLAAQHEGYRRHNERLLHDFVAKHTQGPAERKERRTHRKVLRRAAVVAESILGREAVWLFVRGGTVLLRGETIAFEVARGMSSASMGHAAIMVTAVDPESRRQLARLCVYHEDTPALDQLAALGLAVQAGEEAQIIADANLSAVTEAGLRHPLIGERGKHAAIGQWRPRDDVALANERYWEVTKPIWTETLGIAALGRVWSKLENHHA